MFLFYFREMTDMTEMLPEEILEKIFQFISLQDLSSAVLVCRRWRDVGETPTLWSSLHVGVNTRNMSVMPEMLSSRRLKAVRKLTIEDGVSPSEEVWLAVRKLQGQWMMWKAGAASGVSC